MNIEPINKDRFNEFFPAVLTTGEGRRSPQETSSMLLSGAGFTTRYDDNWSYDSIWDNAIEFVNTKKWTYLKTIMDNYYSNFKDKNFEKLMLDANKYLELIEYANKDMFRLFIDTINRGKIKETFIQAMLVAGDNFPKDDINTQIIGDFLCRFDQVFSLSYDPLIYQSTMKAKTNKEKSFCDFFLNGKYDEREQVFKNAKESRDATLTTYLHGAFFVTTDHSQNVSKMKIEEGNELLIKKAKDLYQKNRDLQPLIVTSASSEEKMSYIKKHTYLLDGLNRLRNMNVDNICIIGFKGNDVDQHIINALTHNRPTKVVICTHGKELNQKHQDMAKSFMDHNTENVYHYWIKDRKDKMLPCD